MSQFGTAITKGLASLREGSDAQISIGNVSVGDSAAASVRVEHGVRYVDVVLPRGEQDAAGRAVEASVAELRAEIRAEVKGK
jgi:hypothetical protein